MEYKYKQEIDVESNKLIEEKLLKYQVKLKTDGQY